MFISTTMFNITSINHLTFQACVKLVPSTAKNQLWCNAYQLQTTLAVDVCVENDLLLMGFVNGISYHKYCPQQLYALPILV